MSIELKENQGKSISPAQVRLGFFVVILISLAAVIIGAVQISENLSAPFKARLAGKTDLSSEEERKEALKSLDTDHDGLSDYDENYIYLTSPFIEDSDSDGDNDKTEILSGRNPNCPKGKNCFVADFASSTPLAAQLEESAPAPTPNLNLNPADLRRELEQLGVPKALLSKLADADLQKLYNETLLEVLATSTSAGN